MGGSKSHTFTPTGIRPQYQDPQIITAVYQPRTPTRRHRRELCQQHPVPTPEKAHSVDRSSARLDHDDQPDPSGTSGQSVTLPQSQPTTEPSPSGNTNTAPTQRAHATVPKTHQSAVCPPLRRPQATPQTQDDQGHGVSGSGHTLQGTEAQDNRETGRTAVRQGEDRPREPTLQEALTNILGAYHHSQETMGKLLYKLQETQRLQEGQYLGIREDLKNICTILVTIAGVLAEMGKTMMGSGTITDR
ncbi:hypothetical protein NDU88_006021 [Pleurodeles waltl]|uniref:Uncharacterized protein n=1 Tax=Pleurodeles waltl TaxID=8319 RepID=A0AAV7TCB9_PLEWA|nr:hypothetical protein NDU88_006021 [Pleurodeles waltl]